MPRKRVLIRYTKGCCDHPAVIVDGHKMGVMEHTSKGWAFVPSGSLLIAMCEPTMAAMKDALDRRYNWKGNN